MRDPDRIADRIQQYLSSLLRQPVKVHALNPLGSEPAETGNKA
jgi:hypothetical protein